MVDRYLKEIKNANVSSSTFTDEQLIMTLVDFIFPALSALPSVVVHAIKLAMHHPEILKNIQEEIDRVVGTGRLVTWEDRKKYVAYNDTSLKSIQQIFIKIRSTF